MGQTVIYPHNVDYDYVLSPSQRYAAGALFGLALNQAQTHQTRPLGPNPNADSSSSDDTKKLWVHQSSDLLRPIFRLLEIDSKSWTALEEITSSSVAKNHIEGFVKLLTEDATSDMKDQELALTEAVDSVAQKLEATKSVESKADKHHEYEYEGKYSSDKPPKAEVANMELTPGMISVEQATKQSGTDIDSKPLKEASLLTYERKVTILYQLLSACLADISDDKEISLKKRNGYDARYRVALRLLSTWLDIKWNIMVAIETMVACSAMAIVQGEETKEGEESQSPEGSWEKWKRGGMIGAAALTGGTLMAITGGLAAPAIASGLGALAPTLGGLVPAIGASGFAAAASAAGTAAGSVAVAASFGAAGAGLTGTKMAKRTGGIDEFEFKAIGENQNHGRLAVGILVSGFVFEEEDFVKPWEGLQDDMERYALVWESEKLIAVSTAIQDWLTSKVSMELMKQGAMMTVLGSLMTALAWPAALLTASDLIDSKWSIALNRSDKAGKLLAEVLEKGLQGQRPVTLVGFSLGARAIFKCLQYLAESGHNAELVEKVVLLGAPIAIKDEKWEAARKVVAGRFVNVFSTNDWMLGVAFRASLLTQGLAGIQPVDVPGIENVDVTDQIEGHSSYLLATQQILNQLQLDAYYPVPKETLIKP